MTGERMDTGYEHSDARLKPLLWFAAGLALLVAAAMWGMWVMDSGFERSRAAESTAHPLLEGSEGPGGSEASGAPALQADPALELAEVRRKEQSLLDSYGWVDPENGVVRIPIERAMALLAERGPRRPLRKEDGR